MRPIEHFCPKYCGGRGTRGITGKVHSVRTLSGLKVKLMSAESQSMAEPYVHTAFQEHVKIDKSSVLEQTGNSL